MSLQTVVVKLKKFKVHKREKMVSEQTGLTLEQRRSIKQMGMLFLKVSSRRKSVNVLLNTWKTYTKLT